MVHGTWYMVHGTWYRVQSTEYRVQSTEYRVQSTECRVQSTEYRVRSTEYGVQSTEYRVQSTEYRVQSTEYRVQSTEYRVQRTKYKVHSTKYTVHSTQYTTRKLLPVCDTLGPCRLSCTCVDSNLDPFRLLLLKCINIEKTHLEFTDFNFWFNICWFRRVKIVSIRCIFGFVLSFRTTFVGVLLAPTVFRVVSALPTVPTFNRILVLVLVLALVSSLLPFALALAMLCPFLCQTHRCPFGRLLVGVTNLSFSRFVLRGLYTHSTF